MSHDIHDFVQKSIPMDPNTYNLEAFLYLLRQWPWIHRDIFIHYVASGYDQHSQRSTMLSIGKPSTSIRAIYTMANCECHNQRLISTISTLNPYKKPYKNPYKSPIRSPINRAPFLVGASSPTPWTLKSCHPVAWLFRRPTEDHRSKVVAKAIAIENGHRNSGFSHEKWWICP